MKMLLTLDLEFCLCFFYRSTYVYQKLLPDPALKSLPGLIYLRFAVLNTVIFMYSYNKVDMEKSRIYIAKLLF